MTENESKLQALLEHQDNTAGEIAELEKAIAEEQKPKLRHGDYGLSDRQDSSHLVCADNAGALRWTNFTGGYDGKRVTEGDHISHFVHFGNIFDDLTALQEDVTGFDYDNTGFRLKGRDLQLKYHNNGRGQTWNIDLTPELVMQIRQMEATLKRREAGQ